jgi:hypothetical protein
VHLAGVSARYRGYLYGLADRADVAGHPRVARIPAH